MQISLKQSKGRGGKGTEKGERFLKEIKKITSPNYQYMVLSWRHRILLFNWAQLVFDKVNFKKVKKTSPFTDGVKCLDILGSGKRKNMSLDTKKTQMIFFFFERTIRM